MKRTPIKPIGKVTRRRQRGMKSAYPVICERAGGVWNGSYCEHAHCELCGRGGIELGTAHIKGRWDQGDERVTNLIALCGECHTAMDDGDEETRERMMARAREIVGCHEKEQGG